jgi:hypothetical protein
MRWLIPDRVEDYLDQWETALARGGIHDWYAGLKRTLLPGSEGSTAEQSREHDRVRKFGTLEITELGPVTYASANEGKPAIMFVGIAGMKPREARQVSLAIFKAMQVHGVPTTDLQRFKLLRDPTAELPRMHRPLFEQLLADDLAVVNLARYLDELHHNPWLADAQPSWRPDHRPYRVFTLRFERPVVDPDGWPPTTREPRWNTGLVADVESSARMVTHARFGGLGPLIPPRYWEVDVPREPKELVCLPSP